MTLVEKIQKTTWYNNILKTRDILLEIVSSAFSEAPIDGNIYGRKNGDWEQVVSGGGGVEEAPEDGNTYGRKDATWEQIVVGGSQDLQSVLDIGATASVDSGNSTINLLDGAPDNRTFGAIVSDGVSNFTSFNVSNAVFSIETLNPNFRNKLTLQGDVYTLARQNLLGGVTTISFIDPTTTAEIKIPAPTIIGDYKILVEHEATYTVATLPLGALGDRAIVTNALAPTYLGAVVGGGAVKAPVWHNGTIWVTN